MLEGLKKAVEIIENEKRYAREVNPLMALGMSQVQMLIEKEIKKLESEDK